MASQGTCDRRLPASSRVEARDAAEHLTADKLRVTQGPGVSGAGAEEPWDAVCS